MHAPPGGQQGQHLLFLWLLAAVCQGLQGLQGREHDLLLLLAPRNCGASPQFGKYLEEKARPEWAGNYLSYKALKDLIKESAGEEGTVRH